MQDRDPTFEELEKIRQRLIKEIEEAEKLFANDPEELCTLNTVKSGLKLIEEKIEALKKQGINGADGTST